ncbi:hypothetical protein MMC30_002017 [Trapelia coarctata]|nr:hypothetical protein [Trapelia coarctata]
MHLPTLSLTLLPLLSLSAAYHPQDLYARDPSPRHQRRGVGGSKVMPEGSFPPVVPGAGTPPSWNPEPAPKAGGSASGGPSVSGVHLSVVLPTCSGEPQKVSLCQSYCSCFGEQVRCQRSLGPRLGEARASLIMQRERMCTPSCVCEKKKRSLFRSSRGKKAKAAAAGVSGSSAEMAPPRRGYPKMTGEETI